ncbi:MAG: PilZ domain-containing protein [Pseudomonadota bacterium]
MAHDSSSAEPQPVSLKALRLRPGLALQTQGVGAGASKEEAQFLAAIESKGVMVGPHSSGAKSTMQAGAEYLVRGFTGQHDFSFKAKVIQIFEHPFAYALLAYPSAVNARLVRRALRLKTSRPAKISLYGQSKPLDVTLIDVSNCGSMVHSPTPLGAIGEVLSLSLSIEFEGDSADLTIPATICHSNKAEQGDGVHVGLAFKPTSKSDKLLLHFLAQSSND